MSRQLTVLDQVISIAAGFVMCVIAVVVAWSISRCMSEPAKPWSNEEIMLAVQHCERLGLATKFELNFTGFVVGSKCGSSGE